jgi:hypothetical protein
MHNIEKNLVEVNRQIKQACLQYSRHPQDVTLLAVSKTHPASAIEIAFANGQRDFGENYVQEAQEKISTLQHLPVRWHYIGPVQSNKTSKISALFDWVHSVDRFKVAQKLNTHRPPQKPPLNILLQVNIDNEINKGGIQPEQVYSLAQQIETLDHIKLRGLMAIPARQDEFASQRKPLARMHNLMVELQKNHPDCDTLSMGMSADMKAAIAEGSTLVRIGTAIFGARLT